MKVLIILILLLDQTSSDYDLLVAQLPKDSNLNKVDKITQTYTHTHTHTHTHTPPKCTFCKYKYEIKNNVFWLNPIQDGHFQIYSRMGGPKSSPPPSLKSVIYIWQRWKLAQLYFTWRKSKYTKDIQITWLLLISAFFSPEISSFFYIKKYRCRLHFKI